MRKHKTTTHHDQTINSTIDVGGRMMGVGGGGCGGQLGVVGIGGVYCYAMLLMSIWLWN